MFADFSVIKLENMSGIDNPISISDEEVPQRKRNNNVADRVGGGDGASGGAEIILDKDSATTRDRTDFFNVSICVMCTKSDKFRTYTLTTYTYICFWHNIFIL